MTLLATDRARALLKTPYKEAAAALLKRWGVVTASQGAMTGALVLVALRTLYAAPPCEGVVHGQVMDSESGEALSRARIQIRMALMLCVP